MRNPLPIIALVATLPSIFGEPTATKRPSLFRVVMEWTVLNFTWPDRETYARSLAANDYVPKNCLIAGVNARGDYIYLTLPRMKSGVPATLTRVPRAAIPGSPLLEPYPSWAMNALHDCDALQNTQNVEIDARGRMWILDSGRTATLSMRHASDDNGEGGRCPPKLIVYDMNDGNVLRTYRFPETVVDRSKGYLYDLVIDAAADGDDHAYVTDNSIKDPGLIVYSYKRDVAWKLRHATMRADLKAAEFRVGAILVSTPMNIAGIALGPRTLLTDNGTSMTTTIGDERDVYYCPISSYHLYKVNAASLKNESFASDPQALERDIVDVGVKGSQTDGMIMDDRGTLYYGLLGSSSVSMWDTRTPFASGQRIIVRDARYVAWPNSFAFDDNGVDDGNLFVLVNNLHRYVFDTLDAKEYNFRLLMSHTGTKSYIYDDADKLKYRHDDNGTTASTMVTEVSEERTVSSSTSKVSTTMNYSTSEYRSEAAGDRLAFTIVYLAAFVLFLLSA